MKEHGGRIHPDMRHEEDMGRVGPGDSEADMASPLVVVEEPPLDHRGVVQEGMGMSLMNCCELCTRCARNRIEAEAFASPNLVFAGTLRWNLRSLSVILVYPSSYCALEREVILAGGATPAGLLNLIESRNVVTCHEGLLLTLNLSHRLQLVRLEMTNGRSRCGVKRSHFGFGFG